MTQYRSPKAELMGKFISKLLKDKELNQRQFAKRANLEVDYVSRLANGNIAEPRLEQRRKIAQGLGMTEQEFQQQFEQFCEDEKNQKLPKEEALETKIEGKGTDDNDTNNPSAANGRDIPNNLPAPTYTKFIGREAEMTRLLELLSPDHSAHIITVVGIGGVGKTALVVEVASICLEASCGNENLPDVPTFGAIIFISAKEKYLTSSGMFFKEHAKRNLRDVCREIAATLNEPTITQSTREKQLARVRQMLSKQDTLLIVDNMETMQDDQEMKGFLYDLPVNVKVVITTRERMGFVPIVLPCLPQNEGMELIRQQADEKGIELIDSDIEELIRQQADEKGITPIDSDGDSRKNSEAFREKICEEIYEKTGGVPIAIVYAIGQIHNGYSLDSVLKRLASHTDDVAEFCFKDSVQPMAGQPSHKLLMSLAIFDKSPIRDAIAEVAGLTDPNEVNDGLALLQQLSLVNQKNRYYGMLSLTRHYALAELAVYPDFEQEARERWVKWYLDFTQKYGGLDQREWHTQYDNLEDEWENIQAVLNWCVDHERYEEVKNLCHYVKQFLYLFGYWDDGLFWADKLIEASERRADWATTVSAKDSKGWLLLLRGDLKQAETLLEEAWKLRENTNILEQAILANHRSVLCMRHEQYEEARNRLNNTQELLNQLEDQDLIRSRIFIDYTKAECFYLEKNYDKAKELYQEIVEQAEKISWQRLTQWANKGLADIAIKQRELDKAEKLLETGLIVVKRNKDKKLTAHYQESFAELEKERGNTRESKERATEAMNGFKHLGMRREEEKMEYLINSLSVL